MKISEYNRGYTDATRKAITWLHAEALRMNDPAARAILNNAAFGLGVASAKTRDINSDPIDALKKL